MHRAHKHRKRRKERSRRRSTVCSIGSYASRSCVHAQCRASRRATATCRRVESAAEARGRRPRGRSRKASARRICSQVASREFRRTATRQCSRLSGCCSPTPPSCVRLATRCRSVAREPGFPGSVQKRCGGLEPRLRRAVHVGSVRFAFQPPTAARRNWLRRAGSSTWSPHETLASRR